MGLLQDGVTMGDFSLLHMKKVHTVSLITNAEAGKLFFRNLKKPQTTKTEFREFMRFILKFKCYISALSGLIPGQMLVLSSLTSDKNSDHLKFFGASSVLKHH